MNAPPWVTIGVLCLLIAAAIRTIGWTHKRILLALGQNRCSECGYSLSGLDTNAACPECGLWRWAMTAKAPRWLVWSQCMAIAAISPCLTVIVALLMLRWLRPQDDPQYVAVVAAAPHLIPAFAILAWHRASGPWPTVAKTVAIAVACNSLMVLVMYVYWTGRPQYEDFGWPITNIVLLSAFYGLAFLLGFAVMALATLMKRRRRARTGER